MRLAIAFAIGYLLGIAAALHYAERESIALDDAELPIADPYVLRYTITQPSSN